MKKCKFKYKFNRILISIMCIITLLFGMPVKSSAGVIESFADVLLWIFDLPMRGLNYFLGESDSASYIDVNLAGWDLNLGTRGMLYNFEITPDKIFSAGKQEEIFVPANLDSNVSTVTSKTQEVGVYNYNTNRNITLEGTPIYTAKAGSEEATKLQALVKDDQYNLDTGKLIEFLKSEQQKGNYSGIIPNEDSPYVLYLTDLKELTDDTTYAIPELEVKTEKRTILPLLDANFFSNTNSEDENNSANILRGTVSAVYTSLASFSILLMLLVLLYIGIRIIISAAADDKARYKEMLVGWVIGLCLIFCMHFIMSFISQLNELIVNTLGSSKVDDYYITVSQLDDGGWGKLVKNANNAKKYFIANKLEFKADNSKFEVNDQGETTTQKWNLLNGGNSTVKVNARLYKVPALAVTDEGKQKNADYALYRCNIIEYMRTCISVDSDYVEEIKHKANGEVSISGDASGSEDEDDEQSMGMTFFAYAILYMILVAETLAFAIKYLKRVIYLAFYTMIAPLIALMYPMDKVGDGKAQTFNMWFKEYLFNSLLQPLHLLLYTIFIVGGQQLAHNHCIYAIGFYMFMLVAEGFFKKLFGFDKANLAKGLGSPFAAAMSMKAFDAITGLGPPGSPGSSKGGGSDPATGGKIKRAKEKFGQSAISSNLNNLANTTSNIVNNNEAEGGNPSSIPGALPSISSENGLGGNSVNGLNLGNEPNSRGGKGYSPFGVAKQGIKGVERGIARRLTGGKTGSIKAAFQEHKLDMLKNGGKTALKVANRAAGAAAGSLIGLTSGAIATAVTGDASYLSKGITTGAVTGFNRSKNNEKWITQANETNKKMYAAENAAYAAKLSKDEFVKNNYNYLDSLPSSKKAQVMETLDTFTPYMDFKDTNQLEAMNAIYQENKENMSLEDIYNSSQDAKAWGDLTDSSRRKDYENYLALEERKNVETQINSGKININCSETEVKAEEEAQRKAEEEAIRKKYSSSGQPSFELNGLDITASIQDDPNMIKELDALNKKDFKQDAMNAVKERKINDIVMDRVHKKADATQEYQMKMK